MEKEQYVQILQEFLLHILKTLELKKSSANFEQDNNSKHISKLASEWFIHCHIKVLLWPSNSPDMNPMEHILTYLQTCI